ncbi:anti-phage dCTP deaminase [Hymenobacter saemangeumensis]|uniref:Anti-phage dCTP deaminase n=1 Tax=Hymenobacter saemangeumensis TaxID=1084522 RepID=A0ABP8IL21_9BACT
MNSLDTLFQLRSKFIVLGLTGRTGSGCSTIAKLLSQESFSSCQFPAPKATHFENNEERKYNIVYSFAKENWTQFTTIKVSSIITSFVLDNSFESFQEYLTRENVKLEPHYESEIKPLFNKLHTQKKHLNSLKKEARAEQYSESEEKLEVYKFYFDSELNIFSELLKTALAHHTIKSRTTVFQGFGSNIRASGNAFESGFTAGHTFMLAEQINKIIKSLRDRGQGHIIIDSLRNPLEALFFKERYSAFYILAVNAENKYRFNRLHNGLTRNDIDDLDKAEYSDISGEQIFHKQDIKTCIQISDIYIHNPDSDEGDSLESIKRQLVKYLTLIQHPGLITPSPQERCMQTAYTAKYNSGCISRQVGAVVTDKYFSIKAIGWNNTAEGQTPCLLRDVRNLKDNTDKGAFSKYELENNNFQLKVIEAYDGAFTSTALKGRSLPFCFKSAQNCIDNEKNQVHTRSLHAEENAFLQITKYGGEGIKGGRLFTTASPCELCSKKAFQLGIKHIHYIDPYPGIAQEQILESGTKKSRPKLVLFEGAIGRAYHQLYEPVMAYKDELKLLLGIDYKFTEPNKTSEAPSGASL